MFKLDWSLCRPLFKILYFMALFLNLCLVLLFFELIFKSLILNASIIVICLLLLGCVFVKSITPASFRTFFNLLVY